MISLSPQLQGKRYFAYSQKSYYNSSLFKSNYFRTTFLRAESGGGRKEREKVESAKKQTKGKEMMQVGPLLQPCECNALIVRSLYLPMMLVHLMK
jgi:hypothetical protein